MKYVLFINPPVSMRDCYGRLAPAGGSEPPVGLCYLASVTRREGYKTKILDAKALNLNIQEIMSILNSEKPDYVALSSATITIHKAARIAKEAKNALGDVPVIIGGCHISAVPDETLKRYPDFDIGVVGEGEKTIVELLEALNGHRNTENVSGIVFRRNKEVIRTMPGERIRNLDELPFPAYDLLPELNKYYRIPAQSVMRLPAVSLVTSRGCKSSCTFCDRSVFGNFCRSHSAGYVADMIKFLVKKYGVRTVLFEDDDFFMFKKRIYQLVELLKKAEISISWTAVGRIDMVTAQLLKQMKEAGCWQINYGIETASQKILDFYKKKMMPQQAEETLRLTKEAGISTKGFFMAGNPMEDENTLNETLKFIKKAALDDISLTFFTPFPGSQIYKDIRNYGTLDDEWSNMSCFKAVFVPSGLTRSSLEKWVKKTYRIFYFRPGRVTKYLRVRGIKSVRDLAPSALALAKYTLTK